MQLSAPTSVELDAHVSTLRTVWVFGLIGYRIDSVRRCVEPLRREGGRVLRGRYTVELLRPLSSPDWLPFVLRELALSDHGPQRHLLRSDRSIAREESWIAEAAYERLLRDERFRQLRRLLLPSALGLSRGLLGIALACRARGSRTRVSSAHYSLIWRHEDAFRAVALDSPRLLPLAYAAIARDTHDARDPRKPSPSGTLHSPGIDLVRELYLQLRARGLPRAAWRHLAREGTAFLQPVWGKSDRSPLDTTAGFLRALAAAGIRLPPARPVLSLWLRNFSRTCFIETGPRSVPLPVTTAWLREAQRVAGTPEAAVWQEDAPIVLAWARAARPEPDKLQRRAGWPWMLRQARAWERRRILLAHDGPREWPCALDTFEADGLRATAIRTLESLVDEGEAFHNCLGTLAGACNLGRTLFYAVRGARTGKCVAVACVAWLDERAAWALGNLKGPANTDAAPEVFRFGKRLAAEYARRAAHLPPPPPDPIAEILYDLGPDDPPDVAHALSHQPRTLGA